MKYILYAVSGFLVFGGLGYYSSTGEPYGAAFMVVIGLLNLLRAGMLGRKK